MRIGLISDTHGLLRPQAIEFLRGSDHIVHGGDIGDAAILGQLGALATLTALRGNNDVGAWADALRDTALFELRGVRFCLIHDLAALAIDPAAAGVQVVVSGHSHRPRVEQRNGVWFVNPGSAGPRRFSLPVSVGEVLLDGGHVAAARTVELDIGMPTSARRR